MWTRSGSDGDRAGRTADSIGQAEVVTLPMEQFLIRLSPMSKCATGGMGKPSWAPFRKGTGLPVEAGVACCTHGLASLAHATQQLGGARCVVRDRVVHRCSLVMCRETVEPLSMPRSAFIVAALVCSLVGCANSPSPTSPSKGSDPSEPESTEADKTNTAAPQASGSDTSKAAPSSDSVPAAQPSSAKPPCSSLQKSKCKVTQGCAWYEQTGKGKCVDE